MPLHPLRWRVYFRHLLFQGCTDWDSVRWTKRQGVKKRGQRNGKKKSIRQTKHIPVADNVSTSHALVYTLPTRRRQDLSCQLSESAVYFSREVRRKKIKHGEQQQSHFNVSTYINAMDFLSFSDSQLGCRGAWASRKLSAVWMPSVVIVPTKAKAKGSFDVFTMCWGVTEQVLSRRLHKAPWTGLEDFYL